MILGRVERKRSSDNPLKTTLATGRVRIKRINLSPRSPTTGWPPLLTCPNLTPLFSQFSQKIICIEGTICKDALLVTLGSKSAGIGVGCEHQFDRSYMNLYGHFPVVNIRGSAMQ